MGRCFTFRFMFCGRVLPIEQVYRDFKHAGETKHKNSFFFWQVSTWFANARRRLKKENKVTWGRSAEDRDGRIFSSDNEDEHGKNGSDDDDDEVEIDLETVDIERPEEQRTAEPRGEGEADTAAGQQASEPHGSDGGRTLSVEAAVSFNRSPVVKLAVEHSPSRQECQRPQQSKPKIWSLAETATAPDSSHKPSPAAVTHHPALASAGHPALLPGHGIYTCQIGKLHNWANAAFLNANSLLNMRSLLGGAPSGHLPLHGAVPVACQEARAAAAAEGPGASGPGASGPEDDSDVESSGSVSPKRDGTVRIWCSLDVPHRGRRGAQRHLTNYNVRNECVEIITTNTCYLFLFFFILQTTRATTGPTPGSLHSS